MTATSCCAYLSWKPTPPPNQKDRQMVYCLKITGWTLAALALLPILLLAGLRGAAAWREAGVETVPQGRFIETSLGDVFSQEWGDPDGPVVILVHGTMAWSAFWDDTAKHLAKHGWRVVAIDLPPFGYSERIEPYDRSTQAQRLLDIASHYPEPPVIVGHSFGAGPVMQAALTDPESFDAVVVVNAALGLETVGQSLPGILQSETVRELGVAASMTNPLITQRLVEMFLTFPDQLQAETVATLQAPLSRPGTTAAYAQWSSELLAPAVTRSHLSASYAEFPLPLHILWSDLDKVTPLVQGQALAQLVPGARLTILEQSGHIPQIETPEAFHSALAAALNGLRFDRPVPPPPQEGQE